MTLLTSSTLDFCVDCVEFCPFSNHGNLLACGMYQLKNDDQQSKNQIRTGGVDLFRVTEIEGVFCLHPAASHRLDTAGILGLRWISERNIVCACSDGQLRFIHTTDSGENLDSVTSVPISTQNGVLLLTVEMDLTGTSYLIGDSVGSITMGCLDQPNHVSSWDGHQGSEIWSVNFSMDSNLLFTGADDCKMKCWDSRTVTSSNTPLFSLIHDAGVTAIVPTSTSEKILTGSYDDHLRLWDLRSGKSPLNSINLGGGVWRIRRSGRYLLCACMYTGWCLVDWPECSGPAIVMRQKEFGDQLLYGIDWSPERKGRVATSTFYDRSVRLYDISANIEQ